MTPQEFVTQLRSSILEENVGIYRDLFVNTPIDAASDPYWKCALEFFRELSPEQQLVFFDVIRQVIVDTTSNLLGIIDGVNPIKGGDVVLQMVGTSNKPISGDLQSLFLADEEKNRAFNQLR